MRTPYESNEFFDREDWRHKADFKKLEISNVISSWTDVCGFGSLLERNSWDLGKLQEDGIVKLLNDIHFLSARPFLMNIDPFPNDKVIVLNDGVARTIDLTYANELDGHTFLMFFRNLMFSHRSILHLTHTYGIGVRTVVAGGERVQYSPIATTGKSFLYYNEENPSDFGKKFLNTTFVYNPAEFQMNTAFAKAYTIDSLGTKSNITVNGFFLEKDFLEKIKSVKDLKIKQVENTIQMFYKKKLMFDLNILDTIKCNIKGLSVEVYNINSFFIHKDFDGDDLLFKLNELDPPDNIITE